MPPSLLLLEFSVLYTCASVPALEELKGNVRAADIAYPLLPSHQISRAAARVLQVKVLALSQNGPARPPASCETLSE